METMWDVSPVIWDCWTSPRPLLLTHSNVRSSAQPPPFTLPSAGPQLTTWNLGLVIRARVCGLYDRPHAVSFSWSCAQTAVQDWDRVTGTFSFRNHVDRKCREVHLDVQTPVFVTAANHTKDRPDSLLTNVLSV